MSKSSAAGATLHRAAVLTATASLLLAGLAFADPGGTRTYRVTIENLTANNGGGAAQVLSPALVLAHTNRVHLFEVGMPANQAVVDVAEDAIGATGLAMFGSDPEVASVMVAPGAPIAPGASASFEITTRRNATKLSLVSLRRHPAEQQLPGVLRRGLRRRQRSQRPTRRQHSRTVLRRHRPERHRRTRRDHPSPGHPVRRGRSGSRPVGLVRCGRPHHRRTREVEKPRRVRSVPAWGGSRKRPPLCFAAARSARPRSAATWCSWLAPRTAPGR